MRHSLQGKWEIKNTEVNAKHEYKNVGKKRVQCWEISAPIKGKEAKPVIKMLA